MLKTGVIEFSFDEILKILNSDIKKENINIFNSVLENYKLKNIKIIPSKIEEITEAQTSDTTDEFSKVSEKLDTIKKEFSNLKVNSEGVNIGNMNDFMTNKITKQCSELNTKLRKLYIQDYLFKPIISYSKYYDVSSTSISHFNSLYDAEKKYKNVLKKVLKDNKKEFKTELFNRIYSSMKAENLPATFLYYQPDKNFIINHDLDTIILSSLNGVLGKLTHYSYNEILTKMAKLNVEIINKSLNFLKDELKNNVGYNADKLSDIFTSINVYSSSVSDLKSFGEAAGDFISDALGCTTDLLESSLDIAIYYGMNSTTIRPGSFILETYRQLLHFYSDKDINSLEDIDFLVLCLYLKDFFNEYLNDDDLEKVEEIEVYLTDIINDSKNFLEIYNALNKELISTGNFNAYNIENY